MRIRRAILPVLLLALTASACASGSGGTALYRRDIGTASGLDAVELGLRLVQKHQYEVFSVDSVPEIRILTHWRPRRLFTDEQALGITEAESRMLITARQRGQTELGSFYAINLTLENRIKAAGSPDWNEAVNTPQFVEYVHEITDEYRRWVRDIGVRRF